MKKSAAFILTVAASLACVFCAAGCKNESGKLQVFVPDGAPAISLAGIAQTEADEYFDVTVVAAKTINSYVAGKMEADVAIMPVNAAVKQLGSGDNYTLLGTVTHGNLFIMKKASGEDISSTADLSKLVGKTVGVMQLANVPGLTFKTILHDNDLEFNELKDGTAVATDKINLKDLGDDGTKVAPNSADCDYFVVPEPAATTKQTVTNGKLEIAGNLQTLYGEGGYPQAVAVAKNSVIQNNPQAIEKFMDCFELSMQWVNSAQTTAQQIYDAIDGMTRGDLTHAFTSGNLTKEVIANCGINFEQNVTGKAKIMSFMEKLNDSVVSSESWGTPADKFFYAVS